MIQETFLLHDVNFFGFCVSIFCILRDRQHQECMIDEPKCTIAMGQIKYIVRQRNRIEIELYQSRS